MKLAREDILALRADFDKWKDAPESRSCGKALGKMDQLLTMALSAYDKAEKDDSAWISTSRECFKEVETMADFYGIPRKR